MSDETPSLCVSRKGVVGGEGTQGDRPTQGRGRLPEPQKQLEEIQPSGDL